MGPKQDDESAFGVLEEAQVGPDPPGLDELLSPDPKVAVVVTMVRTTGPGVLSSSTRS